jgi:uroporphyrinogen-III synthase
MEKQPDLSGRIVAIPETRELDVFARMLEERGATAMRCPLVAIHDAPDAVPVEAWLKRFSDGGCDDLILLTGEGLRRLVGFARRAGLEPGFIARLGAVRKITRGPKPARALRELGLGADLPASAPTSKGVIESLSQIALAGRRIGVQLYPDHTHEELLGFLASAGAIADTVTPYVYASATEDGRVADLIDSLATGTVDIIAFTSAPQVRRLIAVAEARGLVEKLRQGLALTRIAAVGPVVTGELTKFGAHVAIAPKERFFMKPLINAMIEAAGR